MSMTVDETRVSLITRLDPRTRLLAAAGAAVCFSLVQSLPAACACLGFALMLAAVRGPAPSVLLRQLAAVNVFIVFLWLTVPLTMPGDPVASLGPLVWSRDGVRLAALVTVKCNAILLAFLALVDGMDLSCVGCALERLRVPAKLVFLFLFTCRYINVIGAEWRRLWTAAELRGFIPRNSMHTYRTVGNMLGLVVVNGIDRSRRIHEAMLLRGFSGTFRTTRELRAAPRDFVFAAFVFAALAALLLTDVTLK